MRMLTTGYALFNREHTGAGPFIPQIEAWLASYADDASLLAQFDAHRVPCGPVLSPLLAGQR